MIVYKTTNLLNSKIYVGKDCNNNPRYFGSGKLLLLAVKKYGRVNFKKETLERIDIEHLKSQGAMANTEILARLRKIDASIIKNLEKNPAFSHLANLKSILQYDELFNLYPNIKEMLKEFYEQGKEHAQEEKEKTPREGTEI